MSYLIEFVVPDGTELFKGKVFSPLNISLSASVVDTSLPTDTDELPTIVDSRLISTLANDRGINISLGDPLIINGNFTLDSFPNNLVQYKEDDYTLETNPIITSLVGDVPPNKALVRVQPDSSSSKTLDISYIVKTSDDIEHTANYTITVGQDFSILAKWLRDYIMG